MQSRDSTTAPTSAATEAPLKRAPIADAPDDDAQAARGDDELMSQPPRHSVADITKTSWDRRVGRAKKTWSKLAGADLVRVDGDMSKLADLLKRNYRFGDAEVDRQIARFLEGRD